MKRGEKILLGAVAALFFLGLGSAGLLLFESGGKRSGGSDAPADVGRDEPQPRPPVEEEPAPPVPSIPGPSKPRAPSNLPLVEVVVQRCFDPYAASNSRGAPERGTGRSAALDGRVTDLAGAAVRGAKVRFTHGLNAGEAAEADAEGRYEFKRLYPGAQLLEVEIPGREPVLREVRLLPGRAERSNFHFASPFDVAGQVLDRRGKPVQGAEVAIDARTAATDEEGKFFAVAITPGDLIVYVRAKGFAPLRVPLSLPPGPGPDGLRLVLEGAGTLLGESRGSPFAGGSPFAALVPDTPPIDRSFPFEQFGRVKIEGNGPFAIPGVPLRKLLRVRVFHPLARARPPMRTVFLREPGEENLVAVKFEFEPLRPLRGVVLDGEKEKPLAGAAVSLEVADLFRETIAALPGAGGTLNAYVATPPPDLRSGAKTEADGKFALGTGEGEGWRWLTVSALGFRTLERAVPGGKAEVAGLHLFSEEAFAKGGELVFAFAGSGARRVALTLNGSAREEEAVAAGEPFVVSGLPPGIYEVKVRLGGRVLYSRNDLPVGARREIPLPD